MGTKMQASGDLPDLSKSGAPVPSHMPYLLANGQRFPLKSGINFIGRDQVCDIFISDPHISRTHASVDLVSDGTMTLMDLGSTNGIVVNEERVPSAILQPGDSFTVGQTLFKVGKD